MLHTIYFQLFCSHLSSEWEATRIEALHWISTLLDKHRDEVPPQITILKQSSEIIWSILIHLGLSM